ncbi:MAG: phospholipid-binding protein MlaC [Thiohalocapsa sp.]
MRVGRRTVLRGGIAAAVAAAAAMRALQPALAQAQTPAQFIAALGNQAFAVIEGNYSIEQKLAYFRLLLRQDFDIAGSAPFVLGPYWRVASEAERAQFVALLVDYIVITFGRRLAEYGGQSLRVTGGRKTEYETLVTSELARSGGQPVRVDWVLVERGGVYRVADVVVDGVSMRVNLRSEIGAMLQRSGGVVGALLMAMRQVIAQSGL